MLPDWKLLTKEERTELVAPMVAQGLSAAQIAAGIENASRSAIIGHCDRNKIKLGRSVTDKDRVERARQMTKVRHAATPRKKYQRADPNKIESLKLRAAPVVVERPAAARFQLLRPSDCTQQALLPQARRPCGRRGPSLIQVPPVSLVDSITVLKEESERIGDLEEAAVNIYPNRGFDAQRLRVIGAMRVAYRTLGLMAFDEDASRKFLEEMKAKHG
jgi:hypothetical protein